MAAISSFQSFPKTTQDAACGEDSLEAEYSPLSTSVLEDSLQIPASKEAEERSFRDFKYPRSDSRIGRGGASDFSATESEIEECWAKPILASRTASTFSLYEPLSDLSYFEFSHFPSSSASSPRPAKRDSRLILSLSTDIFSLIEAMLPAEDLQSLALSCKRQYQRYAAPLPLYLREAFPPPPYLSPILERAFIRIRMLCCFHAAKRAFRVDAFQLAPTRPPRIYASVKELIRSDLLSAYTGVFQKIIDMAALPIHDSSEVFYVDDASLEEEDFLNTSSKGDCLERIKGFSFVGFLCGSIAGGCLGDCAAICCCPPWVGTAAAVGGVSFGVCFACTVQTGSFLHKAYTRLSFESASFARIREIAHQYGILPRPVFTAMDARRVVLDREPSLWEQFFGR